MQTGWYRLRAGPSTECELLWHLLLPPVSAKARFLSTGGKVFVLYSNNKSTTKGHSLLFTF